MHKLLYNRKRFFSSIIHYHNNKFFNNPNQYSIIMLNKSIDNKSNIFNNLWNDSMFRICCDGAANHLVYKNDLKNPNVIIGDFDSITTNTLKYFQKTDEYSIEFKEWKTQDINDLEKALLYILSQFDNSIKNDIHHLSNNVTRDKLSNLKSIYLYGDIDNKRIDHFFGIVNLLSRYTYQFLKHNIRLLFITENSYMEILIAGTHIIEI